MLGFAALLFFAWTGITLNHPAWFGSTQARFRESDGQLEIQKIQPEIDRMEVVESLREKHSLRGRVTQFDSDSSEVTIVFKGPGYLADVLLDPSSGHYTISESTYGTAGLLNDLHKGRDAGKAWSLLIDVSAIVMITFSLTGFGLILFLRKRRTRGVTVALLGTLGLFFVCYWASI
jgi:hypothetical protein